MAAMAGAEGPTADTAAAHTVRPVPGVVTPPAEGIPVAEGIRAAVVIASRVLGGRQGDVKPK